jgi:hypothetical protein
MILCLRGFRFSFYRNAEEGKCSFLFIFQHGLCALYQ